MPLKDLVKAETTGGFTINVWEDEEGGIFTTIGHLDFCLPKEDFNDLVKFLCIAGTNIKGFKF